MKDVALAVNVVIFATSIWEATKEIRIAWAVAYRTTAYLGVPDSEGECFQTQVEYRF